MNAVICPLSIVPVRAEPSDRSEMVSQWLFGETAQVLDTEGKTVQRLEQPDNKDQHHVPPLLLWQQLLLTGTDDGRVLFYTLR